MISLMKVISLSQEIRFIALCMFAQFWEYQRFALSIWSDPHFEIVHHSGTMYSEVKTQPYYKRNLP